MTLLKSQQLYVLGLYRSKPDKIFSSELCRVIPADGPCLVIGDFNICSQKSSNHQVFHILRSLGFNLLLHESTHFEGGHLDQAWIRNQNSNLDIELYSPYYNCKDHDALLFTIFEPSEEKGESYIVYPLNKNFLCLEKQSCHSCLRTDRMARTRKGKLYISSVKI